MGRHKKDKFQKQIEERFAARTTQEHADYQAKIWVAHHGIVKAEIIALLTLEKIRAQK